MATTLILTALAALLLTDRVCKWGHRTGLWPALWFAFMALSSFAAEGWANFFAAP